MGKALGVQLPFLKAEAHRKLEALLKLHLEEIRKIRSKQSRFSKQTPNPQVIERVAKLLHASEPCRGAGTWCRKIPILHILNALRESRLISFEELVAATRIHVESGRGFGCTCAHHRIHIRC